MIVTELYIPPARGSISEYNGEKRRDINTSKLLKQSTKLFLDGEDVSKLTENDKQKIFKESSLKTIGILLWEFATGTGKNVRDFYYNEHPFATEYVNSRVNEIIYYSNENFKTIGYETKDGVMWNTEEYKIGLPFSPTINPASWGGSAAHLATSNAVCQFIGGAVANLQIVNGTITGTISNNTTTSKESLMLHLGDNYTRKNENGNNRILSTITQKIHFTATITK